MDRPSEHVARRVSRTTSAIRTLFPIALLGAAWSSPMSASPSGTWSFVTSPVPPTGGSSLNAVDALAPADAWAVGTTADQTQTLTMHWNGAAWSIVPSPSPSTFRPQNLLTGLAAIASDDVWAVGSYNSDGGNGTALPTAQTLAEHWDGSHWRVVASPALVGGTAFEAVSALSPSDVWAVGLQSPGAPGPDETPLAARWNGSRWESVPTPFVGNRINRLYGVSARTADDAWAVGMWRSTTTTFHILIVHWNGVTWGLSSAPDPGINDGLNAVKVVAADDVWAVGERVDAVAGSQPLIMHWNGASWSTIALPVFPGDFHRLNAIDAVSPTDIWTSGAEAPVAGGPSVPLLMHWDGRTWSKAIPATSSGTSGYLNGVAVVGAGDAWAVGSEQNGSLLVPLTERFADPGVAGVGDPTLRPIGEIRISPNPSRGSIGASFAWPAVAPPTAAIYDAQGRLVRALADPVVVGIEARARWDGLDDRGRATPAGVYIIRVRADGRSLESSIVRIR